MPSLVIVESAVKAKTIAAYLNDIPSLACHAPFTVIACLGHIQDLPTKELGVSKKTWVAKYVLNPKKRALMSRMRKLAKEVVDGGHKVYLASDADAEGCAIAAHLKTALKLKREQYERVTFNEITKSALEHAFNNCSDIDPLGVDAQETRRILDRLVGYELSPLLWRKFSGRGLSAGRVQSAALGMVLDRARKIQDHTYIPFWGCDAVFKVDGDGPELSAKASLKWDDAAAAEAAVKVIAATSVATWVDWSIAFSTAKVNKNPSPPFTTSTLQQECYQRYGIPAKSTMKAAQALYEAGFITYMRTDSTALSQDAQDGIVRFITDTYGVADVTARTYQPRAQNAQCAHEAIRPCDVNVKDVGGMDATHQKIYDLIWRRAVASQMAPAVYTEISYDIACSGASVGVGVAVPSFKGKTSILTSAGYLKVQSPDIKPQPHALDAWSWTSGTVSATAVKFDMTADVLRPRPLYNEASFVKALETEGIGRPSTYSGVVDKLYDKGYVVKSQMPRFQALLPAFHIDSTGTITKSEMATDVGGKETDYMTPTALGERVLDFIQATTPYLVDVAFSSRMEKDLDRICEGAATKKEVLDEFYKSFSESLAVVK